MDRSKLEIKIIKDAANNAIELKELSLPAAQAFLALFESLTNIVALTPNNKDIRIQIRSGSAVVAAEGEMIQKVKQDFDKIIENKSSDKELVDQWRRIQSVFAANSLHYEASFYTQGQKVPFYEILKSRQKLRARSAVRKNFNTSLVFLSGRLISVGGKSPNIHIETGIEGPLRGDERLTIACTELNANKAKLYLYQTIRCSVWVKKHSGNKQYTLCDSYGSEETFLGLKRFIHNLFSLDQIEALKMLHYRCRDYLDIQDYGGLRKFLRLFAHESTDVNILKTLLIVTQSFKEQEKLKLTLEVIESAFQKHLKEIHKNNSTK